MFEGADRWRTVHALSWIHGIGIFTYTDPINKNQPTASKYPSAMDPAVWIAKVMHFLGKKQGQCVSTEQHSEETLGWHSIWILIGSWPDPYLTWLLKKPGIELASINTAL